MTVPGIVRVSHAGNVPRKAQAGIGRRLRAALARWRDIVIALEWAAVVAAVVAIAWFNIVRYR